MKHTAELRRTYVINNSSLLNQLNKRLDDYFTQLEDILQSIGMDDVISNICKR